MGGMPVIITVGTAASVTGALERLFGVRDVVREIAKENYDSGTTPHGSMRSPR